MQEVDSAPAMQESGAESPPTPLEEGYLITLKVSSDGYTVDGPDPLPAQSQEEEQSETPDEQVLPDITSAVKAVLSILKSHPIGQDEQTGFKSATSAMGQE